MANIIDKIQIGLKIKEIREQKNLSQIAFSQELDVKQQTISQVEKGIIAPSLELLIKITSKYCISIESIVMNDETLKTSQKISHSISQSGIDTSQKTSQLASQNVSKSVSKSVSKGKNNVISIPITDISVAAGYGSINNDYIEVLDNIQLPATLVKSGTHLCVKIKGDSMAPTLQDGGFMIIRNIDRSEWIRQPDERIYVVSTTDGVAYLKRLKLRMKNGFIVCMSDSPDKSNYPNFNIDINEIHTLWYAEWYLSAKMPNIHDQYYNRLQRIEDDLDEIKAQFKRINK